MRKMYLPRSRRRHLAPDLVVGAPRRLHRAIDILRVRLRDLGELLFRGRIDRLELLLRVRLDELAADEEVVARRDLDVIGRLERRRVLPQYGRGGRLRACRRSRVSIFSRESLCYAQSIVK